MGTGGELCLLPPWVVWNPVIWAVDWIAQFLLCGSAGCLIYSLMPIICPCICWVKVVLPGWLGGHFISPAQWAWSLAVSWLVHIAWDYIIGPLWFYAVG